MEMAERHKRQNKAEQRETHVDPHSQGEGSAVGLEQDGSNYRDRYQHARRYQSGLQSLTHLFGELVAADIASLGELRIGVVVIDQYLLVLSLAWFHFYYFKKIF